MNSIRLLVFLALAIGASAVSWARLVLPPPTIVVASPNGGSLLRIDPAPWRAPDPAQHATASVFRYDPITKSYRLTSTFALRNRVSPDIAAISDDATYIATCDDWDEIGCTPNTVVVYRGSGEILKAWSLEDIFTPEEIRRFGPPQIDTRSRYWRGSTLHLTTRSYGTTLSISPRMDSPWQVGLNLDMTTLKFTRFAEHWIDPKTRQAVPAPLQEAKPKQ